MSKEKDILQLKKHVPQFILKLLGYKISSKNEKCTAFKKVVYGKDEYNYGIGYEIHIFLDNVFNTREICVVPHYFRNNMYDWFNGEEALSYLYNLDKRLVKFTELRCFR